MGPLISRQDGHWFILLLHFENSSKVLEHEEGRKQVFGVADGCLRKRPFLMMNGTFAHRQEKSLLMF